ncbi:MAG: hypothetical protein HY879_21090 [Deltaproteobacteria bacterium]|nr:hypothetical protein [Deltaproteobacteria bacterium]
MKILRIDFPPPIGGLLRTLSEVGFFDRSLLIGSWVMLIYQELYGVRYLLRTFDIDFAVHFVHPQKQIRADLERLITDLGFVDFIAGEGVQKFTAAGYEVEFIVHRPGGREFGALTVREWNINALPLPFINILTGFSETLEIDGFSLRIPIPEAYFIHKLIIASRRLTAEKRGKDFEQCAVLIPVLEEERLLRIMEIQRFGKETRQVLARSCDAIGFPLQRLFFKNM